MLLSDIRKQGPKVRCGGIKSDIRGRWSAASPAQLFASVLRHLRIDLIAPGQNAAASGSRPWGSPALVRRFHRLRAAARPFCSGPRFPPAGFNSPTRFGKSAQAGSTASRGMRQISYSCGSRTSTRTNLSPQVHLGLEFRDFHLPLRRRPAAWRRGNATELMIVDQLSGARGMITGDRTLRIAPQFQLRNRMFSAS